MQERIILISDDDPQVVRALARQLRRLPLPLRLVFDERCEVASLARQIEPDLIVLDMVQPVPGLELLQALRAQEETRDLRIVAVSAVDDDETRRLCQRHGVMHFVLKPFDDDLYLDLAMLAYRLHERAAPMVH